MENCCCFLLLSLLILLLALPQNNPQEEENDFNYFPATPRSAFAAQERPKKTSYKLSKPLLGDDGKIYTCSERNAFAFESNGSIAWTTHLNYSCHAEIAPIRDEFGKIYLLAENRVLKITPPNFVNSESTVEVFFGDKSTTGGSEEIIGISVSLLSSSIFINVKNRGLFAYMLHGQLLWSAGPVLQRSGYRQGCKKNITDCFFASAPVVDQCEGSIYISNTEGELYSLAIRSPHFKWIQDFSAFDKQLIVTPGNNGRVYVTIPVRSLLFALDVSTGNILWQSVIGPLSTTECSPVVDTSGWISFGSLDGFLYSFSPTGFLKKFPKANFLDSVIQVSPLLDCSGYSVYISQTQMEGKFIQTTGGYTSISAMKPKTAVFTSLVPASGSIHWTANYAGELLSMLAESDLHHFALDERILLAFVTATKMDSPLSCRTSNQKITSTCSQARTKQLRIYTGSERTILLFLLFQTLVLMVLAGFVRFCCIFWRKKKLRDQDLGKFLEKRRSLRIRKKEFDRTITELEQKAAEEAVANEVLEKLGDLVKEREGIKKKLSTTYSLGRDRTGSLSRSLLPLYNGKAKSYSFQGRKKESVTIFHTPSGTSSRERSTSDESRHHHRGSSSSSSISKTDGSEEETNWHYYGETDSIAKGKAQAEDGPSGTAGLDKESYWDSPRGLAMGLRGFRTPLSIEHGVRESSEGKILSGRVMEPMQQGSSRRIWLKRRGPCLQLNKRKTNQYLFE